MGTSKWQYRNAPRGGQQERHAPPPRVSSCGGAGLRAQVEPGGGGSAIRSPTFGPEVPTSELQGPRGGSQTQHSPPQSADVRRTQEQQQEQPQAGGRGRLHHDSFRAGGCGQGARLRGQPLRAGARAQASSLPKAGLQLPPQPSTRATSVLPRSRVSRRLWTLRRQGSPMPMATQGWHQAVLGEQQVD